MSTRSTPRRLFVGLSGGVDSAVAAGLLKAEGHDVQAVFMKNWEEDDTPGHCAAATDLADARAVADALGIPLHAVNFATEYWDRVFAHFLAEYRAGRTPNPDVLCNREIKFRAFLDHALARGADAVATGHYARVVARADGVHLARSADEAKDQTYFLYQLDQSQLRHAIFPLADLTKPEVRALARRWGLPNHARRDSTGICFIGERRFRDFLARYLPAQPGDVELPDGRRVGRHGGLLYYTPGQRHGLALGGVRGAGEAPWFVVGKDLARNVLVVAQDHDHPRLMARSLVARPLHWVLGAAPATTFRCLARCRHRQPLQDCTVEVGTDGSARVVFAERQRALAPGQSVVWYQGADCLGGGVIDAVGE
ncbi:MAG: tRNA 2-thiouridine(34) synthase MnmA [Gammaproteobacteria bacterium]|nr:tRNA 2-thiouridine(34) synthase MnmA [Gammaproteobacteria bacterium]